jgi:hypothetical protein
LPKEKTRTTVFTLDQDVVVKVVENCDFHGALVRVRLIRQTDMEEI